MKRLSFAIMLLFLIVSVDAQAVTPMMLLKTSVHGLQPPESVIMKTVRSLIDVMKYRKVNIQVIRDAEGKPMYYLIYLFSKKYHRVDFAKIAINEMFKALSIEQNYKLQDIDFKQQPGGEKHGACPDLSVQFIVFAPNAVQVEQDATADVASAAIAAKLNTVKLLKDQATRENYLNYLTCPQLLGNFYDGDSNPQYFITVDGLISADDIKTILKGKFQYRTTNIWLACEAYNDPMFSAVTDDAQAKKFVAGINDLLIGPSDKTGACAMKAAIAGKPMQASFNDCYQQFDDPHDHWGFGGKGTDNFWSVEK